MLTPGCRLGPYEVIGSLGAGGMGEVYRARDTRLDRTVALKVLPAHIASDGTARDRFEREARAVAALNHPHICTLHDIGRAEVDQTPIDYLVLEYIVGETLASRLGRGALPLDLALRYASEIASALDRAHRAGIVHRDIKPGNVMVTKAGLKLLDFGLAKAPAVSPPKADTASQATDLTDRGLILGTVQYMAPEQITGGPIDSRTDIFALGAVLFEMVTGTKVFAGDNQASVLAAILEREAPRLSAVQPLSPPALDRVVATCLAKDPDDRWQTARDLLRELQWVATAVGEAKTTLGATIRASRTPWVVAAVLLLAAFAAGVAIGGIRRSAVPAAPSVELDIASPPETTLMTTVNSIPIAQFALSPDGRTLAFVAADLGGVPVLWVRPLESKSARRLAGTEGAYYPFWAPDSQGIGFFAAGKLRRTSLAATSPQDICDAADGRGASWSSNDTIVFALIAGGILRVPASGGIPEAVTTPDASRGEINHRWPSFLPDGTRFVYVARGTTPRLRFGSLVGTPPALEVDSPFSASVAGGHLLFVRNRALVAQPFDGQRVVLTGEPTVVVPRIGTSSVMSAAFSASTTGDLVYAGDLISPGQLTWFDRQGRVLSRVGGVGDTLDFDLSPDGRRLAASRVDLETSTADVWLIDLDRGTEIRFTTHARIEASALWDVARPRIVFRSDRQGAADMWIKDVTGTDVERFLFKGNAANASSWSPDGRTLLYNESMPATGWDIYQYSVEKNETAPFINTPANETHGRFSPDGRWVVYSSNEAGRWDVYARPVHGGGERVVLSDRGGFEPRWRGDGKEVFYLTPERQVVAVEIRVSGGTIQPGAPRRLFDARMDPLPAPLAVSNGYRKTYTVTPDGQRFLVNVLARDQNTQTMSVLVNWPSRLRPQSR